MAIDYTPSDTTAELQQLDDLRQSIKVATLTHLRESLSETLPFSQAVRIVGHKNVELELNRLIQRVSLEPHSNIDSLSFKIAQGLTQVAEPHVRMAINLATAGENQPKPEDILQDVIKQNANVQSAYNPLSDSLRPADPNSQTSKLYEKLKAPLVNGPNGIPTLKPEIDKVVALGLKEADAAQQQKVAESLNQDLLGELLTHQATTPTNTGDVVKNFLKSHGLDTNSIDSQSFSHFVDYVNKYHQIISTDDQIALAQIIAESKNLSSEGLQSILSQAGLTPEDIITDIQTTPTPTSPESAGSPVSPTPLSTPSESKQIEATIRQADQYDYSQDSTIAPPTSSLRQAISLIRRFFKQTDNQSFSDFLHDFVNIFRRGSPNLSQPLSSLGNAFKNGASQVGRSVGNAAKEGARAAAKAALNALKAGLRAFGKLGLQLGKSLLFNPYFWLAVVVIIILAAILYYAGGASPPKVSLMQTSSISGRGGGSGGLAFICKPDDPGCPKSLCSDCQSPVTCGIVTQCPGGNYSHSSTNAIDFGVGGCSAANLGVYSQFEGTVVVVVMDYLDGSGYEGSSEGYANHVDIQFTDPDTGRSFILRYAHLSQQSIVAVGDSVSPGQLIGYADHTGNSSGPHLHYELLATDGGAVPSITTIVPNSGCE